MHWYEVLQCKMGCIPPVPWRWGYSVHIYSDLTSIWQEQIHQLQLSQACPTLQHFTAEQYSCYLGHSMEKSRSYFARALEKPIYIYIWYLGGVQAKCTQLTAGLESAILAALFQVSHLDYKTKPGTSSRSYFHISYYLYRRFIKTNSLDPDVIDWGWVTQLFIEVEDIKAMLGVFYTANLKMLENFSKMWTPFPFKITD